MSTNYEIHDSSIAKTAKVCDKAFSQLLLAESGFPSHSTSGLSQITYSVVLLMFLGTVELFLSAVGAFIQGKDGMTSLKSDLIFFRLINHWGLRSFFL